MIKQRNGDYKTYKRTDSNIKILIFLLLISQVCSILAIKAPIIEYIPIVVLFFYMFVVYNRWNYRAIIYGICIYGILNLGIIISTLLNVRNDNFFLCVAITVNCIAYCNLAYGHNIDRREIDKIFDYIIYFGIISCFYNIGKNLSDMFSLSTDGYAYGAVFSAFYSGRNTFAAFLTIYIVLCVYEGTIKKQMRYFLFFIILVFNLFFTFSRASILFAVLFVAIFMFLYVSGRRKRVVNLVILSTIIAIIAGCLFYQHYDYFEHYLIRKEYGDSYRFIYWSLGGKYFLKSPIFGYGPGAAEKILSSLGKIAGSSFHNTYIEIGMWGGVLLLIIYGLILLEIYKALKIIKKWDVIFYKIYIAFLLAFLIRCLFETTMLFGMGGFSHLITIVLFVIPIMYSKGR